jgi:hypothetical protein
MGLFDYFSKKERRKRARRARTGRGRSSKKSEPWFSRKTWRRAGMTGALIGSIGLCSNIVHGGTQELHRLNQEAHTAMFEYAVEYALSDARVKVILEDFDQLEEYGHQMDTQLAVVEGLVQEERYFEAAKQLIPVYEIFTEAQKHAKRTVEAAKQTLPEGILPEWAEDAAIMANLSQQFFALNDFQRILMDALSETMEDFEKNPVGTALRLAGTNVPDVARDVIGKKSAKRKAAPKKPAAPKRNLLDDLKAAKEKAKKAWER